MEIAKAIIPVAGWGTRWLPITKVIEKCMLPIGNRPLIDYIVQDCVSVGIKDIYFVVGENSSQLEEYYSRNLPLENYLRIAGKEHLLPLIDSPDISFHYVVQPQDGRYGTAIPVALCAPMIGHDPVVVMMGDDFIYAPGQSNQIQQLMDALPSDGSCMLGVEVPMESIERYGALRISDDGEFQEIVEHPSIETVPSNLINVSKYIMNSRLIQHVVDYASQDLDHEYLITDPINSYVADGGVMKVAAAKGRYLDGGTLEGWLEANRVVCG